MKVIVDAGHGGKDSGALGPNGLMEKHVALSVAKQVCRLLVRAGAYAVMTRTGDTFVSLTDRASCANAVGAALLSIHCNAGGGKGFECFTTPGETKSDKWATEVMRSYAKEFPDRTQRADMSDGDPDKEARFTVLTKTKGPAILFELGFIDTVEGAQFLASPIYQERMAWAIARGTLRWLGFEVGLDEESFIAPESQANLDLELVNRAEEVLSELVAAINNFRSENS